MPATHPLAGLSLICMGINCVRCDAKYNPLLPSAEVQMLLDELLRFISD